MTDGKWYPKEKGRGGAQAVFRGHGGGGGQEEMVAQAQEESDAHSFAMIG